MKLRIRQRGNLNIVLFSVYRGFLFTPMLFLPLVFYMSDPVGWDWLMLLWMIPLSGLGAFIGAYSLNEVIGFLGGHYLVYPKKNEVAFQKTGSIYNQRYIIPITTVEDLEWRGRKSQLYFLKTSDWIYCSREDAKRIEELFERLIAIRENNVQRPKIGK